MNEKILDDEYKRRLNLTDLHFKQYRPVTSPISEHITSMKQHFKGDGKVFTGSFKYNQDPLLVKPTIKDIIRGGTIDRVFSKTILHETDQLRCSDGIIMPAAFLSLMNTQERTQALKLLRKGLLIVSICTAPGYFSKHNQRVEYIKEQIMVADPSSVVFCQGSPRNSENKPQVNKHVQKFFCQVIKFSDTDDDSVKVPYWILQKLGIREGQPICVQIPRKPG